MAVFECRPFLLRRPTATTGTISAAHAIGNELEEVIPGAVFAAATWAAAPWRTAVEGATANATGVATPFKAIAAEMLRGTLATNGKK
mmetsp:Transcript_10749/g.20209  ORF Transcript_10749/g.20209 Transcript_10749/m.20209 type:complete len:87 (-) Transcript_10749:11-271(-)